MMMVSMRWCDLHRATVNAILMFTPWKEGPSGWNRRVHVVHRVLMYLDHIMRFSVLCGHQEWCATCLYVLLHMDGQITRRRARIEVLTIHYCINIG